jgi:hypothetical protein
MRPRHAFNIVGQSVEPLVNVALGAGVLSASPIECRVAEVLAEVFEGRQRLMCTRQRCEECEIAQCEDSQGWSAKGRVGRDPLRRPVAPQRQHRIRASERKGV